MPARLRSRQSREDTSNPWPTSRGTLSLTANSRSQRGTPHSELTVVLAGSIALVRPYVRHHWARRP